MDFILRKWKETDAESVAKIANNKKIAANLRNAFPYPYTLEDAKAYIEICLNTDESKNLFYAIEIDGKAVGSIGVFVKDDVYCKSAEIGYWLGEDYWGKGIMSEAIRRTCQDAFKIFDIVRIFADPYAYNMGSRGALEKAGFKLEGVLEKSVYKNGTYFDSCVYALIQ